MPIKHITAQMGQDMVDRISAFQKERGIGLFSYAVMEYITYLESIAIPATKNHERKLPVYRYFDSVRPYNIDGDGRPVGEF